MEENYTTLTKRAKTGFIGEFYIYSELIKHDKNCFITLGNAKSVDLILVDRNKRAHFIDVKTTNTEMNNTHKHDNYESNMQRLGRWQLGINKFWETHTRNTSKINSILADFYIFHNLNKISSNYIITGDELQKIMHKRIDIYLAKENKAVLDKKNICNWEICELCFEGIKTNNWNLLP